jgi:hypothetical protein
MTEMSCEEFRAVSAEFALGVLEARERALAVAHLERCASCRDEVRELVGVADGIAALAPLVEPPSGFESRVTSALRQLRSEHTASRWRRRTPIMAIAAALLVAAGFTGWALRGPGPANPGSISAQLTAARLESPHRVVGDVVIDRADSWVSMAVDLPRQSGWVTCEVVTTRGQVVVVGSFDLNRGYGYWSAPLRRTMTIDGARLLDDNGITLASSSFAPVRISHIQ